ncbi:hypothetical protein J5N97_026906 [Dioscorea zingiberensis]|uniref:Uncharacterized protein n=1 Tax=Dioscorea zingiberensis TaxID=325984 RepID=A0A9D5C3W2_9LILI|nr:hypothetical protein J5N97_026906 [Dioscorea zingiberensis]
MESSPTSQTSVDEERAEEGETVSLVREASRRMKLRQKGFVLHSLHLCIGSQCLRDEMHWSFVFGVVTVYGISQGLEVPFGGLLLITTGRMFRWCSHRRHRPAFSLLPKLDHFPDYHELFIANSSAGVAISDVTIDACVAQNSISHPTLAADMQTLCGFSASIGRLLGFSISGLLVHAIGSQVHEKFLQASQETVGFILSVGSVGSLLGVLLYQNLLKDCPFRNVLFWSQLLSSFAGMLDLVLVLRLNLKVGMPDYFFVVIDESVSQLIGNLKWMPLLVLSSKLCPLA